MESPYAALSKLNKEVKLPYFIPYIHAQHVSSEPYIFRFETIESRQKYTLVFKAINYNGGVCDQFNISIRDKDGNLLTETNELEEVNLLEFPSGGIVTVEVNIHYDNSGGCFAIKIFDDNAW